MDIEHLVFENGPKRVGPFSHAVKAGEFIFITGQMPTLPENPDVLVSNDVEKQTHQVMKNLISVLDNCCLLYTSPSPRDKRQSRMPSSA